MVTKLVALEKSTSQMFLGRNWLAYSMAFKLIICLIAIVIGVVSGKLPTLNVGVFPSTKSMPQRSSRFCRIPCDTKVPLKWRTIWNQASSDPETVSTKEKDRSLSNGYSFNNSIAANIPSLLGMM